MKPATPLIGWRKRHWLYTKGAGRSLGDARLLISPTCQSATAGQPKAAELARLGIDLCVLVPHRWCEYGTWRGPDVPTEPPYCFVAGRVMWPWIGPAQWYLHWYPGLARLLQDFRPDIIDLWEEPWGLVSAHACWLRNRLLPECKIVSETEQNIDKRLPPPFESLRKYTLRNADFVIGRNRESVEIVGRRGTMDRQRWFERGGHRHVPAAGPGRVRRMLGFSGFVAGYAAGWWRRRG